MSTEITTPTPVAEPVESAESSEVDANEAEYQAAMAKIRGEQDSDEAGEDEEELSDEEREYREAMAKARGEDKEEKKEAKPKPKEKAEEKKEESARKVWKLKVRGKEVDYDYSDEEKNKQFIQKGLASDDVFQDAAKIKKNAENFVKALQGNFGKVLLHPSLGIPKENIRKWAEEYLYGEIRQESMSPEERARLTEQEELETFRAEKARREEESANRHKEELKERYRSDWSQKFTEALEAGGLPKTVWTLRKMATYMREALAKGYKHIQPADVVHLVKEDWITEQKQMFSNMDGEKLIEILGKETADKIRRANLKRLEGQGGAQPTQTNDAKIVKSTAKKQPLYGSTEEMMRSYRRGA